MDSALRIIDLKILFLTKNQKKIKFNYNIFISNQESNRNSIFIVDILNYMVIITLQRKKCIGCNYCVELAPKQFQMSKKDGKAVLLHAIGKKGFFTIKSPDISILESVNKAKESCPVKIINVKLK